MLQPSGTPIALPAYLAMFVECVVGKQSQALDSTKRHLINRHLAAIGVLDAPVTPVSILRHPDAGFLLGKTFVTYLSTRDQRTYGPMTRKPIHESLEDEAFQWQQAHQKVAGDAALMLQSIQRLYLDQESHLLNYLPEHTTNIQISTGMRAQLPEPFMSPDDVQVALAANPALAGSYNLLTEKCAYYRAMDLLT